MTDNLLGYGAPLRDMQFLIEELLQAPQHWAQWPDVAELLDPDTARAVLEEAGRLSSECIAPLDRAADEEGCHFEGGAVRTPAGFRAAWQAWAAGGWVGVCGSPEYGGMGMPKLLGAQIEEMLNSASLSFGLYPMLTSGLCVALAAHGSAELCQQYLPPLYSGEWAGAMCLTEAHAGSDLGLIRTRAEPQADGSYRISGSKIFITAGEHDLTGNIIHLVLARLPGALAGPRGISMFLVPKVMPDGRRNGLSCGSIEHKMGIKASSTCVMNFDGATGWLVGEVNRGLNAMFTMMNYERIGVGIQGLAAGERSLQRALAYAHDRLQGRAAGGALAPEQIADPLIVHADVRRMLLTMKALTEGGRALSAQVALWLDESKFSPDAAARQRAEALVALCTPVVKAFLTDAGFETCVLGQQVFGGHGYIREWGQEQLVRDVRITQIYEGTNGIQALDLLGRKVVAGGLYPAFSALLHEPLADLPEEFATPLAQAIALLDQTTAELTAAAASDPEAVGAAAVEYLQLFGYVACSWLWARMAALAAAQPQEPFCAAKLATARFWFARVLPRVHGLQAVLRSGSASLGRAADAALRAL